MGPRFREDDAEVWVRSCEPNRIIAFHSLGFSMTDPIAVNRLNWDERATIHARDTTGDYMLARFRAGEDALIEIEAAELGDVAGKRILHLQCHIGRDTLCLARRGATVTGLDFSPEALSVARQLASDTGLAATFVEGTVDDAPRLTPGPFDMVYSTWGTICWLPDMRSWARVIASVLAPGGELYFADMHPAFCVLEQSPSGLVVTYDHTNAGGSAADLRGSQHLHGRRHGDAQPDLARVDASTLVDHGRPDRERHDHHHVPRA